MAECRFTVPGKPFGWQRTGKRLVMPKEGRPFVQEYTPSQMRSEQAAFRVLAAAAMRGAPPFAGPVTMRLIAYYPIPPSWPQKRQLQALAGDVRPTVKPDLGNVVKSVEDALNQIVYRDDAQIVEQSLAKVYGRNPRVVVLVAELFP